MLCGPTGAGKTTLARIYGKAVLCQAPAEDGSPCQGCQSCQAFDTAENWDFHVYGPARQGVSHTRELVDDIQPRPPWEADYRVFFFDEVADMGAGWGPLLEEIAHPQSPAVFIFTLNDPEDAPKAARDRLDLITLHKPSPLQEIAHLRGICDAEAVTFEDEGLELIAMSTDSFREAIRDMQTCAQNGPLTSNAVQEALFRRRFGWLAGYFEALAQGDLQAQLDWFEQGPMTPAERAERVRELLNAIKLNFVGPMNAPFRRARTIFPEDQCLRVLQVVDDAFGVVGGDRRSVWDQVMRFWQEAPARPTPQMLKTSLIRFHELLEAGASAEDQARSPASPGLVPRQEGMPGRRRFPIPSACDPGGNDCLKLAQVAEIYEAASLALQAYWAPFNLELTLEWGRDAGDAKAAKAAGRLAHALQTKVAGSGEREAFHRIVLHDRLEDGSLRTRLLAHVPKHVVDEVLALLERKRRDGFAGAGVGFELQPFPHDTFAGRHHWRLVRSLWAGISPAATLGGKAALDVLQVPVAERRPCGPLGSRRYTTSETLGPRARRRMETELAPFRSAFADDRWDWLYVGWERVEFERRQVECSLRGAENAALEARFGGSGPLETEARGVALRKLQEKQYDRVSLWSAPW
jgi:DNA polymerase-3 subunit gamma/tau